MTTTAHARWRRAVEACLDGELRADQRDTVRQHLDDCPDCDRHARLLLALRGSLRRVVGRLPPLSRSTLERLADQLVDQGRGEERSP